MHETRCRTSLSELGDAELTAEELELLIVGDVDNLVQLAQEPRSSRS